MKSLLILFCFLFAAGIAGADCTCGYRQVDSDEITCYWVFYNGAWEDARARRAAEDYPAPDAPSTLLEEFSRTGVTSSSGRRRERYMGQE